MVFGLTSTGFTIKRLSDVKDEIETSLRTFFGPGINLQADQLMGQIVGIYAEATAKTWEMGQGVYDAFYPDSASGINLDNVVAITGIKRLEATFSLGSGIAYGTTGTIITAGSIISVSGNATARFQVLNDATIGTGTDEVQDVDFSAVPDAGLFTLIYDGEETATLAFTALNTDVQSALNNLPSLSGTVVTGNFTSGFTITFSGANGEQSHNTLVVGQNTLLNGASQVVISVVETTAGVLPNVTCDIQAETAGAVEGYADSITVIETPIAGWASFNNPTDVTIGEDIETDAELRLRRKITLATSGASTIEAIRSRLLEIDEVTAARVFDNKTMVTDAFGRPPKSIEAVVQGGDDDEIAAVMWAVSPAGIELYGSTATTIIDSQGFTQPIEFSRPTGIPIYIDITVVTDPAIFPINGDDAIAEAIVDYGDENFSIGDDVITTEIYCPIHEVQGILGITIDIGIAPAPSGTANIAIADDEISVFDTSTISITVT